MSSGPCPCSGSSPRFGSIPCPGFCPCLALLLIPYLIRELITVPVTLLIHVIFQALPLLCPCPALPSPSPAPLRCGTSCLISSMLSWHYLQYLMPMIYWRWLFYTWQQEFERFAGDVLENFVSMVYTTVTVSIVVHGSMPLPHWATATAFSCFLPHLALGSSQHWLLHQELVAGQDKYWQLWRKTIISCGHDLEIWTTMAGK